MAAIKVGDTVQHLDGRIGQVTRGTESWGGSTVSVRFPGHHRISVVATTSVNVIDPEEDR